MKAKYRERLSTALEGFKERQTQRDLARDHRIKIHQINDARRRGRISTIGAARQWLFDNGFEFEERSEYRLTALVVLGMELWFYPNGEGAFVKHEGMKTLYGLQEELWSDGISVGFK